MKISLLLKSDARWKNRVTRKHEAEFRNSLHYVAPWRSLRPDFFPFQTFILGRALIVTRLSGYPSTGTDVIHLHITLFRLSQRLR